MYSGFIIQYQVKLLWLGTQDWITEIKHIVEGRQFVDEQRIGPYKFWYHYHALEETDNGVKMIDQISYQLPFGLLGKAANALFISRQLDSIFSSRKKVMGQQFGG